MNNITILGKDKCCGCSACYSICPQNAISMIENEEGFLYPQIDNNKCINCGLCTHSCPVLNANVQTSKAPKCYACMANDDIRVNSTSGGIFPIFAKYILDNGGFVCGAVWDNNMFVKHIVSNNPDDIEKMRNSKYIQSEIEDCLREIKTILIDNKIVLFTGTPCQVAGLKSYLQKDYDNLYCIDIICHGVPSKKVFSKHINEEKLLNKDEKWISTQFRDKAKGWSTNLTTTITTISTTSDLVKNNSFMQAFLYNLSLRKSCETCAFRAVPLISEITIGDFWGVDNYNKNLNDKKGTSVVLINNNKGLHLFELIKEQLKCCEQISFDVVRKGNPHLIYTNIVKNTNRKLFMELLDKKVLKENVDICLKDKCDYFVLNFGWSWFNYGAVLTAYALQELIKSYGLISKNLLTSYIDVIDQNKNFVQFKEKYLNFTKKYTLSEAYKLTKNIKGVILGSDQILRSRFIWNHNYHTYLLDFVDKNCKKLAISASFGLNPEDFKNDEFTKKMLVKNEAFFKKF